MEDVFNPALVITDILATNSFRSISALPNTHPLVKFCRDSVFQMTEYCIFNRLHTGFPQFY